MIRCEDIRSRLTLFLDEELEGNERAALEEHLKACEKCNAVFENERRFLAAVRELRPLHSAPSALRERVTDLVNDLPDSAVAPRRLKRRIQRVLWGPYPRRARAWRAVAIAAIAILILPAGLWLLQLSNRTSGTASEFALMAADTHLRHVRGQLPLEITSDAPGQISEWFSNKVRFGVKLPNYQDSSGQQKLYRLEGARLVGYKDDYAAYVAYEMKTRPISLVITSDKVAQPTGGEEIKARGLTFHYDAIHGLKVITWSDRGLTYALVSDLEERGQQSCVVCHQGTKDQDFIAPLKPR
jgi:anti-sigma factor (TIGR02949 family)